MFTAESDGERILKIDQHLVKLWAIKYRVVFMKHSVWMAEKTVISWQCEQQLKHNFLYPNFLLKLLRRMLMLADINWILLSDTIICHW